jgi:hypothetical protein
MIISVTGFIGAGKDTIADYLVAEHGFKRESFAGALKDAVASIFGWDRELLEGKTVEGRAWREKVDKWWSDRLDMVITPRWVLQNWGTEVCRQAFHDDIWIASLENKLRKTKENIVISDCRFPNEIKSIRNASGIVTRVIRDTDPEWFLTALDANNGHEHAKIELSKYKIHPSEYAWIGTNFDAIIDNNGTISDLYQNIEIMLSKIGN